MSVVLIAVSVWGSAVKPARRWGRGEWACFTNLGARRIHVKSSGNTVTLSMIFLSATGYYARSTGCAALSLVPSSRLCLFCVWENHMGRRSWKYFREEAKRKRVIRLAVTLLSSKKIGYVAVVIWRIFYKSN